MPIKFTSEFASKFTIIFKAEEIDKKKEGERRKKRLTVSVRTSEKDHDVHVFCANVEANYLSLMLPPWCKLLSTKKLAFEKIGIKIVLVK